ncbi:LacI family DNA-binding transcriptional regulator, partial [Streptococcus danieliae]|nr:LacI family DNA-binding transcriptional regulator [Streptococcus danieliae]
MAKVTITDIAKMVGVSKATVSYYLNGNTSKMSLATQEKIRQIIEETGYQPNKIAQSLATKDTKTIG